MGLHAKDDPAHDPARRNPLIHGWGKAGKDSGRRGGARRSVSDFRLGKHRGKFVIVWSDDEGNRRRHSLGTADRAEADRLFARTVAQIQRRPDPRAETIDDLFEAYIEDKTLEGKNAERAGFTRKAMKRILGSLAPSDLTIEHCKAYAAKAAGQGKTAATIHTELGYLRTALKHARKRKLIQEEPYVWVPPKGAPRERHLTREEARSLVDACELPHMKLFVMLALTTAGRAGAILDLTWKRVDLTRGVIDLRDPDRQANRKGRAAVPIAEWVRPALEDARRGAISDHVIEWGGKRVASVKKGFAGAVRRAGLSDDVTPHVLRHTAAVWMAEDGVPMDVIAQYLGHSDSRTTYRVYARYSPGYLRQAAKALEL